MFLKVQLILFNLCINLPCQFFNIRNLIFKVNDLILKSVIRNSLNLLFSNVVFSKLRVVEESVD